ncbi:Asp23/Gls24 family envelope stress response protein [Nocardiopsis alborubida]|uniref:Asp23/Gls24 family envelope stress response protein n=1 Tax=Nocardiopsis alborubida TaxID=146802 RepID=A0A7X6RNX8_9ACTN|nr:Asp23/Gls24 family envelope stress response protein [Nocardiopsis alborubida]NKY97240.1 Asp23/Gls24 family envelope stress response protein [Nocardiopsis alborubida]
MSAAEAFPGSRGPAAGDDAAVAAGAGAGAETAAGTPDARARSGAEPDRRAPRLPPEERGTTVVSDRAVRRLACAAAAEHRSTRPLGDRLGGLVGEGRTARAEVRRGGSRVGLRLEIAVAYPSPLARTAEEVRAHVVATVEGLTGLTVHSTDIEIVELVPAPRVR